MSMSRPFEVDQVFVSADPRDEGRRVIVLGLPASYGGYGTVGVGTLTDTGRVIRQRRIQANQFHDSAVTATGEPRKRGYILEEQ